MDKKYWIIICLLALILIGFSVGVGYQLAKQQLISQQISPTITPSIPQLVQSLMPSLIPSLKTQSAACDTASYLDPINGPQGFATLIKQEMVLSSSQFNSGDIVGAVSSLHNVRGYARSLEFFTSNALVPDCLKKFNEYTNTYSKLIIKSVDHFDAGDKQSANSDLASANIYMQMAADEFSNIEHK